MSSDLARVAVIAGGLSNEREVSMRSGRRAQYALGQAGVDATLYDADEALLDRLAADRVEAAYLAVHGASGEDGSLQTVLDLVGIPYVGSPPASCHLAWDKVVAKVLIERAGLATPAWAAISARSFRELSPKQIVRSVLDDLGLPVVVKPATSGSTLGMSLVSDAADLPAALVRCFTFGDVALIERYVDRPHRRDGGRGERRRHAGGAAARRVRQPQRVPVQLRGALQRRPHLDRAAGPAQRRGHQRVRTRPRRCTACSACVTCPARTSWWTTRHAVVPRGGDLPRPHRDLGAAAGGCGGRPPARLAARGPAGASQGARRRAPGLEARAVEPDELARRCHPLRAARRPSRTRSARPPAGCRGPRAARRAGPATPGASAPTGTARARRAPSSPR